MDAFKYQRPRDDAQWESWCQLIFERHLRIHHLQKFKGRGHAQCGIDLLGTTADGRSIAVQCKLRNARAALTVAEAEESIAAAGTLGCQLAELIFATTHTTRSLQEWAAHVNQQRAAQGNFTVSVYAWADIEELLNRYADVKQTIYDDRPSPASLADHYLRVKFPAACDAAFQTSGLNLDPRCDFVRLSGTWLSAQDVIPSVADAIIERLHDKPTARIALAGNYGQGKTFLAWHIGHRLATAVRPSHVPVVFPMKAYAPGGAGILQQVQNYALAGIPHLDLAAFTREQSVLLVLDALDEIPMASKNLHRLSELLGNMFRELDAFPKLAVLMTFRTGLFPSGLDDYAALFPRHDVVTLGQWTLACWRALVEQAAKRHPIHFAGGWEKFCDEVESRSLRDLTHRPLWCRMMIETRDRILGAGVSSVARLYDFYLSEFFRLDHAKSGPGHTLEADAKQRVLQRLAVMMLQRSDTPERLYVGSVELGVAVSRELRTTSEVMIRSFLTGEMRTYSPLNAETITIDNEDHHVYSFGHASFCDYFLAGRFVRTMADDRLERSLAPEAAEMFSLGAHLASEDVVYFVAAALEANACSADNIRELLQRDPDVVFGSSSEEISAFRSALVRIWVAYSRTVLNRHTPDLTGFNLSRVVLSGSDIVGCSLVGANLNHARLVRCSLLGVDLSKASCRGTDFTGSSIDGATITPDTDFRGAVGLCTDSKARIR